MFMLVDEAKKKLNGEKIDCFCIRGGQKENWPKGNPDCVNSWCLKNTNYHTYSDYHFKENSATFHERSVKINQEDIDTIQRLLNNLYCTIKNLSKFDLSWGNPRNISFQGKLVLDLRIQIALLCWYTKCNVTRGKMLLWRSVFNWPCFWMSK